MDEAFLPFSEIIEKMSAIEGDLYNDEAGVHSYIYEFDVDTPVELSIVVNEEGKVQIGIVPPLYRVETSFRPSFHRIQFSAEKYKQE
jgi:hypothetical protein